MKNNKIKCLILIVALFIARSQLYVFSQTNSNPDNTHEVPWGPPQGAEKNVELDGQIGEWDPTDNDAPNFEEPNLEIDGNKPEQNDYYTISVTVPLNMEFYVLPNSQLPFGSFFSPEYEITNNGSKTLEVKINKFGEPDPKMKLASDETKLVVGKVNPGDGITQMELKLLAIDTLDKNNNKEIDLTDENLSVNGKLYELTKNETKKLKFSAERWELPQMESNKDKAISNFTARFEFSIKR